MIHIFKCHKISCYLLFILFSFLISEHGSIGTSKIVTMRQYIIAAICGNIYIYIYMETLTPLIPPLDHVHGQRSEQYRSRQRFIAH